MSRIGRKPIQIPGNVGVSIDGNLVRVKGPKGELEWTFRPEIEVSLGEGEVLVERKGDSKHDRALHGMTRSLIANMIEGVTEGFRKTLEIVGVGCRAAQMGKTLVRHRGFSHLVESPEREGVTIDLHDAPTVGVV